MTGGGDCSGLNAAIRAVVRKGIQDGYEVFGVFSGWKGLLEGLIRPLKIDDTAGILSQGGTILGSSRVNPFKVPKGLDLCRKNVQKFKLQVLVIVGGEGTLRIADALSRKGIPTVCIPKTIDNDTCGTDYTIGFQTSVEIATEAIDRLHSTAESHQRVMIVEVMGRHAGWIAAYAGIAGGADAVLVPERPFDLAELCKIIRRREKRGRHFSIFVVSEDAKIRLEDGGILRTPVNHDEYGDVKLGGIGDLLARELEKRTEAEVRVTVLGHVQRGGTPCAFDRVLATRLGVHAMELIRKKQFNRMVVLRGNKISSVPILKSAGKVKTLDPKIYDVAKVFFG